MNNNSEKTIKKTYLNFKLIAASTLISLISVQPVLAEDCDYQPSTDATVSYNFNQIDLKAVMLLAGDAAGKEVIGLDLVKGKVVSTSAEKVNVTAFVDALLLVNGFSFEEQEESWIITKM